MAILKFCVGLFYKLLESVLVFCMAAMLVLVFINVVLRFVFNSGLDISEEVPRFLFVWMTFFGAIIAMRERTHISVTIVTERLPEVGQKLCWGLSQILIVICSGYMLYSTHLQFEIIYYNLSPVLQLSMLFVYGVSYIAAPAIGLNAIVNLVRLMMGRVQHNELLNQPDDHDLPERHAAGDRA